MARPLVFLIGLLRSLPTTLRLSKLLNELFTGIKSGFPEMVHFRSEPSKPKKNAWRWCFIPMLSTLDWRCGIDFRSNHFREAGGFLTRRMSPIRQNGNVPSVDKVVRSVALLTTFVLACLYFTPVGILRGNSTQDSESSKSIKCEATLARMSAVVGKEYYQANIDVGQVEVGNSYDLSIEVANPYPEDISFSEIRTNCVCSKVTVQGSVIPAKRNVLAKVTLTTPKSNPSNRLGSVIYFFTKDNKSEPIVAVHFTADITKNLTVPTGQRLFKVGTGLSTIRIPFVYSDPISVDSLKVSASESLRDFPMKIVAGEQGASVEFDVHRASIDDAGHRGVVTIADESCGASASVEIMLQKKMPITISPDMVRFERRGQNADALTANVIVQVDQEYFRSGTAIQSPETESVEVSLPKLDSISCQLDGHGVDASANELSSGIYRIRLAIPLDSTFKEGRELQWSASVGGKSFLIVSGVHINKE